MRRRLVAAAAATITAVAVAGATAPPAAAETSPGNIDLASGKVRAVMASYPVVATVNVRSGPSTSYPIVGSVSAGTYVNISCQTPGETVTGPLGTSSIWDSISVGRFVSDTYVQTGSDGYVAPRCG